MATEKLQEGVLLNGRYRIQQAVGRGGMGTVYLAEHVRLDAIVAIKEVSGQNPETDEYQAALEQCEQEARFLVRLNHPHLPKVTDAFIENDRFYLVMEFIEGVTLETRLKQQNGYPLDTELVIEWGLQIADVLAYLHSQDPPIIFRDLKPSNAMVQPDGNLRLIDFGIARRFQPGADKDTCLFGSVGYSPPEQFGKQQTDPRSDIYALGAMLHHLLTAQDPASHPFKFAPAHTLNPAVPESLSALLAACLAMEPEARPATVQEVALRLAVIREEMAARREGDMAVVRQQAALPVAPAGPRIISAKLDQAEARKRRESGRSAAPTAVSAGRDSARRPARGVLLAAGLVVLLGGGAVAYVTAGRPPASPRHHKAPVPPAAIVDTQIEDVNASLSQDTQGQAILLLNVRGLIQGQPNAICEVKAVFFDEQGQPITASADRPPSDPDNTLTATAEPFTVPSSASTDYPFIASMQIPVASFPGTVNRPWFRCSVTLNGQLARESGNQQVANPIHSGEAPPGSGANGGTGTDSTKPSDQTGGASGSSSKGETPGNGQGTPPSPPGAQATPQNPNAINESVHLGPGG
ncbi:MAG TPA: serine/threonine-protein kinase [Chthonomonadaceae bacterium]|nr:serine/threonine-protein kinase [Chthonomonadaceae bacterium]